MAGGCPAGNPTNPNALPAGDGLPNENQQTVNGQTKDTGLAFQTPADYQNDPAAPPPPDATPPASVDLTSKLPPIGDQGQLGSCAAWACGYGLATWLANVNTANSLSATDRQASPAFLYAKTMEAQQSTCDSGSQMDTVMNLLISQGCSSLATVPYSDSACATNPSNADANTFRIGSFGNLRDPKDRTLLKKSLAAGRPLAIGVSTAQNFSGYTTGVYTASGGNSNGKHSGHAMVLMGYDDSKSAYRIMNSWNTTWGDLGFMWWDYTDFEQYCDEAYECFAGSGGSPRGKDGAPAARYGLEIDQRLDGKGASYLVFTLALPESVQIESITCSDPTGATAVSGYGDNWFGSGPICFVRPDGKAWLPGAYSLTIRGLSADGKWIDFSTAAELAAARTATARTTAQDAPSGFGEGTILGATLAPSAVVKP